MMLSFISLDKVGGVWDGNACAICAGPIRRHYGHMDPRKRDLISSIWGFQRGDVTIVVFLIFFSWFGCSGLLLRSASPFSMNLGCLSHTIQHVGFALL